METQSKLLSKVPEGICSLIWLSHYSAILKTQRVCPVLRSSLDKQISWEIPSILPKMGMWLSNQHFHTFAFFKADQPWILPCCSFLSFFFSHFANISTLFYKKQMFPLFLFFSLSGFLFSCYVWGPYELVLARDSSIPLFMGPSISSANINNWMSVME